MFLIELLGLAATFFVVISFLFTDLTMVRIVNLCGSVLFIAYGMALVINSGTLVGFISILLVNGILVLINSYRILQERYRPNR